MYTGSRAFCFLMALAATGSEVASATTVLPEQYRVEAKLISLPVAATEIPTGTFAGIFADKFVAQLAERPKADILSFPRVETVDSIPSHVGLTQQMALPDGKSRETGINFDVVPRKKGTDFGFGISISNVRFQGFQDRTATKPLFHTGHVTTTIPVSAQLPAGYYCFNVPVPQKLATTYDADGRRMASVADANERQLLFVKITRG